MAALARRSRGASARLVQAVGSRHRGGLAGVDARRAAAVSRRGARGVRPVTRDARVGLARLSRGRELQGRDRPGHRRDRGVLGGRAAADHERDGKTVLAPGGRGEGHMTKHLIALGLMLSAAACSGGNSSEPPATASSGSPGNTMTIAVIPKGTTHVFGQSIRAGAEKAGKDLGATIIWRGPLREDDRDSQVSEVEGFVSRGVSGIVLAPLDESALVQPVAEATHQKIPVVIFDSGLKSGDYVSFVATDNLKPGPLAAD